MSQRGVQGFLSGWFRVLVCICVIGAAGGGSPLAGCAAFCSSETKSMVPHGRMQKVQGIPNPADERQVSNPHIEKMPARRLVMLSKRCSSFSTPGAQPKQRMMLRGRILYI